MSKVKISEILHIAADEHLWSGTNKVGLLDVYSCNAILAAIRKDDSICLKSEDEFFRRVKTGLIQMGLAMQGIPYCWMPGHENFDYESVQQERYSWLKFAALIAEEQGV